MKIPLRFQVTEFDCGTVSLLNAFSYLFEREEIPAELIKAIHTYTLDCYDEFGNIGQGGTSREAIKKLTHWIVDYTVKNNFKINCIRYEKEKVTYENMIKCLNNNGVIFVRLLQDVDHYVIITQIKDEEAYIFDPYYLDENYYDNDNEVKIILDKPFSHNRIVKLKRLFSEIQEDFSLGKIENRECVLINRIDKVNS